MNWLLKLKELKAKQETLLAKVKAEARGFSADEQKSFDTDSAEIQNCIKMIENEKALAALDTLVSTPVAAAGTDPVVKVKKDNTLFKNFTEQLGAIKNAATSGVIDERLKKINNASGMNVGVGSEGGFAVQTDFAGLMLESAVKESGLLSLVDSYQVSGNADRVSWVDVNETDISTSVFGGVQVYRAAEAATVTATKPSIKEKELKLEKLMGIAYSTFELDSSSSFIDDLYTRAFTTSMRRTLEGEIISGDGVGKATGILTGSGLVTVAKEGGQTADTVNLANITKMYHAAFQREGGRWAWIVNPDVGAQLDLLTFPVGTGGVPVFTPANMLSPVDSLRGVRVIESDHCSALGDKGDIILADLSDYFLAYKGGIQKDVSIHVNFLAAENAFRFIWMVNGRPKTSSTLTIKNSSQARGKYITLAARA